MIEIAAAVCMISAPERCHEIQLTFDVENVSPANCMMFGQTQLAQWAAEHPNWRISKFMCRPAGQVAKL
jgi:hypothetical protein